MWSPPELINVYKFVKFKGKGAEGDKVDDEHGDYVRLDSSYRLVGKFEEKELFVFVHLI